MALKQFKDTISDQKVSLAETYSGPIFQITGLLGTAWLLFMSTSSEKVQFNNEGIQYQMPLLIVVVIVKYVILLCNRFKASRKLFYVNVAGYTLFLLCVILIDYRIEIFGE